MGTAMVTVTNEITLITLRNCPSAITFLSEIFKKISDMGVNIDMISLAPAYGDITDLSFTISDSDLGKILEFTSALRDKTGMKTVVSSGNSKISVYDPKMKNTPGVAAQIFAAAARVNTDLRIITTSEVEVSLLVTAADFDETLIAVKDAMEE